MNNSLQPLERPPALYRSVQDTIRSYIIDNNLQAGDPLPPENELSRQLGVSRNSVREAVKALESLGILETRRGSGLFVRKFSFEPLLENLNYGLMFDLKELSDLVEVRNVLEYGMIESAVEALTPEHIKRLTHIVDQMRQKAEKGNAFIEEDREFHQTLFEGLGNQMLLSLLDMFWVIFVKVGEHTDIWDTNPMSSYQEHAGILEDIQVGNIAHVKDTLRQGYIRTKQRLEHAQREGQL